MLRTAVKALTIATLVAAACPAEAQRVGLREALGDRGGSGIRRNDLEGGIWEYKVIGRTGDKETVLVGKVRIKDNAAFDVPGSAKGKLLDDQDKGTLDEGGAFPFGVKPPTAKRLGVLDRVAEGNRGGDRIADITYEKSRNSTSATPKVTFQFDADDEHPLSGEAQVKFDTRHRGGVWRGSYYELTDEGKKKRWNFEMRQVEN